MNPHTLRRLVLSIPTWVWVVVFYGLTHGPALLALPVFADEAIYIRWAQLFADEPHRYAFFSMADGKPPLFIWMLSAVLVVFPDPLLVGRASSLVIGLATVFLVGAITRLLTGRDMPTRIAMGITCLAPFWWFYHRMALMDGLLTLLLCCSFYFALRIALFCQKERGIAYDMVPTVLLLGASFGGAMMTKTPALFAIPIIASIPLFSLVRQKFPTRSHRERFVESVVLIGAGGVIGSIFFLLLRVSPLFGALFARSSDFTFTLRELLGGEWRYVLFSSLPREIVWISGYMTWAVVLAVLVGLWVNKTRKTALFLIWCAVAFMTPLLLFGRVLYPRYFLPIAPFLTIAAAIGIEVLYRIRRLRLLAWMIVLLFFVQACSFILPALTNVAAIPFVPIDRMQYLEEWSAGYGNAAVRDFVRQRYQERVDDGEINPEIIVLTEGSFGTLPDGLLMDFWGKNQLEGVQIHGVGVGPATLPEQYLRAQEGREVYYVVNSHRLKLTTMDRLEKVLTVARPGDTASLLLFRLR